jgi:hypothetical protein
MAYDSIGSTQNDVYSSLLDPATIKIDNRQLVDFIEQARQLALTKAFTNSDNEIEGNWYQFFENNPLFIAAEFIKWPIDEWYYTLERQIISLRNAGIANVNKKIQDQCLEDLKNLLSFINDCLLKLSHAHTFNLNEKLRSEFKLSVSRSFGKVFQEYHTFEGPLKTDSTIKWSTYWPQIANNLYQSVQAEEDYQKLKRLAIQLKEAFKFLVSRVETMLPYLLKQTGEHNPQVGLLLAFFRTNEFLQDHLNAFTKRHLKTFYEVLLQQEPKNAVPDQAYIIMPLSGHVDQAVISKGEKLIAGSYDDGNEVLFELSASFGLNTANINHIRQLYIARNKAVGVSNSLGFVSGVYQKEYQSTDAGYLVEKNVSSAVDVPLFGEDQLMLSLSNRIMKNASIGFAISSPVLFMKEGKRSISVTFDLDTLSMTSLINYIEEVSISREMSADAALQLMLGSIFQISYTGSTGWQSFNRYGIGLDGKWADARLRIDLALDLQAESITGFDQDIHGGSFQTDEPILKFHLKADDTLFGYSFVKDLAIDSYTIDVKVEGIRSLKLFNTYGSLDQDSLFNPFGTPAKMGSYFMVGYEELATKSLTNLAISLGWFNLPRNKDGFKSYYEAYNENIDNNSFVVEVSMLSDYNFKPAKQKQQIPLFTLDEQSKRLAEQTHFSNLNLGLLSPNPSYKIEEDLQPNAEAGIIKFTLISPEMAFGDKIYPSLLTKALTHNAQEKNLSKHLKEPNEAISPVAKSVRLAYSARTKVALNETELSMNDLKACGNFYHIHPFETISTFNKGIVATQAMLPKYDERGYLFVALSGTFKSGQLNVLVNLDESKVRDINSNTKRAVKWQYLLDNRWLDFKDAEVLSDGTNAMSNTGIIRFIIPKSYQEQAIRKESLDSQNEDERYSWLRVISNQSSSLFPNVNYLNCNATTAQWVKDEPFRIWPGNLAEDSIERFKDDRTEIGELKQPFPSFGGQAEENELRFYQRVANRIHHKNRLFRPKDIEHFLLDNYPYLFQVKCLVASEKSLTTEVGVIHIIAVPRLKQNTFFYLPYLGEKERIDIEQKLNTKISRHIKAVLINPFYERVRVVANMVFQEGLDKGEGIELLNQAILGYLCPWFDKDQGPMNFKPKIDKDLFQDYIESLPFVVFVSKFSLLLIKDDAEIRQIIDTAKGSVLLKGAKDWSVFIPDTIHDITVIEDTDYENPESLHLSKMEIGDDFVLSNTDAEKQAETHLSNKTNKNRYRITFIPNSDHGTV